MSSEIIRSATSVRLLEANEEQRDQNPDNLTPAIRFFGSVDPVKFFIPQIFGSPVFRGDLLALRSQENDFVFLCKRQVKAHCEQEHLDFISFSMASMLHAVQYKELRVKLWNDCREFLNKMNGLQLGGIVHIRMKEISPIPIEAILRCRVAIKTPRCDCEKVLFGIELKEHRNCGDCDGTILGQRIFTCEHNCGMYVSVERLIDICIDNSLHKRALGEKSAPATLIKMTFVGAEGAGKTSLIRTLLGKPFHSDEAATIGAYFTKAMSLFIRNSYINSDENLTYSRFHSLEWKEIGTPEVNSLIHNQFNRKMSEAVAKHKRPIVDGDDHGNEDSATVTGSQRNDDDEDGVFATNSLEHPNDLEVSTSSKDLREAAYGMKIEDQIRFVLSDYGGHLIFHNFHLLFTSEDDVISITVDASHDLDSPVIPRERCDYSKQKRTAAGMLTPLQTIHLWLQSIHARATKPQSENDNRHAMSRIFPTVLIVATHVPWLFFREQQFIRKIRTSLADKPYAQHLPDDDELAFHFINNKHRRLFKSAIIRLKNVLLLSARHLFTRRHPVCYLKFEEEILKAVEEQQEKLTLPETLEIAVSCGIAKRRDVCDVDFLEALMHFTKKGVLLYYPDIPALRDTVFISPQWLADVFSSIITTHNLVKEGDLFRQAWLRYDECGILEERFLDHILRNTGNFDNKRVILGLFEKFNLAVKIPSSTRFAGESYEVDETGNTYIVPSLLIDNPLYRERYDVDSNKTGHDFVSLAFYFPDKFVPGTTVNQLLVKCIQWNVDRRYKLERILYGYGHFRLGGNQFYWLKTIQLSDDRFNSVIYLVISNIESVVSVEEQSQNFLLRQELLEYLIQSLNEITSVTMPTATKPVVHVVCPHCSDSDMIEPHLPLHDIIPDGPLVCSLTGQVVTKEHYSCFFRNPLNAQLRDSTESASCKPSPLMHGPPENKLSATSTGHVVQEPIQITTKPKVPYEASRYFAILEKKVTMTVIPLIASSLAMNWEGIATVLGIGGENNTGEIETIKRTYRSHPTECFFEVVHKWISGSSGKIPKTWGTIKGVLTSLNIDFTQTIEQKLIDYYKRKNRSTATHQLQDDKATMSKVPLLSKQLAPHWISIGYLLDFDEYGFAVQLVKSSNTKPEECFSSIVKEWITGNKGVEPKTWQTFIQILEDMKLNVDEIKKIIFT